MARKKPETVIHIFRYLARGQNLRASIRHFQNRNERRFSSYGPTRRRDHALAIVQLEARAKRVAAELDRLFEESDALCREFQRHAEKRAELLERRKTLVTGQLAAHRALTQIALERAALGQKNVQVKGETITGTV